MLDGIASADRSWQAKGLCRGNHASLFFPPSTTERKEDRDRREHKAKAVCTVCMVKAECLEFALVNGEKFGIWGGMSERERRRLRRARALARRAAAS